jgi:peptidoglycan/LPS O-acetylase OafA/YrhL
MDQIDPSMFPPGTSQDDIEDAIANYYYSCTAVTTLCPVEATTLGYYPNRAINIFLAVGFACAMVVALVLGIRTKTWSFTAFIVAGCALEVAGGLLLSRHPFRGEGGIVRRVQGLTNTTPTTRLRGAHPAHR